MPVLAPQRDAAEQVRCQQREGDSGELFLRKDQYGIEIVFQGCERGLRGVAVAQSDVTAVIIAQDLQAACSKCVGEGDIGLLCRPIPRAEQYQRALCAVYSSRNIVTQCNREALTIA